MLNLPILVCKWTDIHEVRGPQRPLEQVQWDKRKGRFNMGSIFKSWFLGKFGFKENLNYLRLILTSENVLFSMFKMILDHLYIFIDFILYTK